MWHGCSWQRGTGLNGRKIKIWPSNGACACPSLDSKRGYLNKTCENTLYKHSMIIWFTNDYICCPTMLCIETGLWAIFAHYKLFLSTSLQTQAKFVKFWQCCLEGLFKIIHLKLKHSQIYFYRVCCVYLCYRRFVLF